MVSWLKYNNIEARSEGSVVRSLEMPAEQHASCQSFLSWGINGFGQLANCYTSSCLAISTLASVRSFAYKIAVAEYLNCSF